MFFTSHFNQYSTGFIILVRIHYPSSSAHKQTTWSMKKEKTQNKRRNYLSTNEDCICILIFISDNFQIWDIIRSLRITKLHNSTLGVAQHPDPTDLTSILIHLRWLDRSYNNDALMIQLHLTVYVTRKCYRPVVVLTSHFRHKGACMPEKIVKVYKTYLFHVWFNSENDMKITKIVVIVLSHPQTTHVHSLTRIPKEQQDIELPGLTTQLSGIFRMPVEEGRLANVANKWRGLMKRNRMQNEGWNSHM